MSKNFFDVWILISNNELADVLVANQQALKPHHLIITPVYHSHKFLKRKKVEDIGVEPMTPCVQGRCSSQLS